MPPGRPSRLTKQVADNLVKAVGLGLSYKDAAAVAGIGKSTFHEWKKRAEIAERSNKYTVLMERIDAALQKRGEEYLDAVRRSILEDIIIEKTHVKRLPDGTEIKEIAPGQKPLAYVPVPLLLRPRYPDCPRSALCG